MRLHWRKHRSTSSNVMCSVELSRLDMKSQVHCLEAVDRAYCTMYISVLDITSQLTLTFLRQVGRDRHGFFGISGIPFLWSFGLELRSLDGFSHRNHRVEWLRNHRVEWLRHRILDSCREPKMNGCPGRRMTCPSINDAVCSTCPFQEVLHLSPKRLQEVAASCYILMTTQNS